MRQGNSIKMDKLWIVVLLWTWSLCAWTFHSAHSFQLSQQQSSSSSAAAAARKGCAWLNGDGTSAKNNSSPVNFSLDCNLRTLSTEFWNYSFSKDQIQRTSTLKIKCNDKLFFESFLRQEQSFLRLVNLRELSVESCKIRRMPGRIWASLGFLKKLTVRSRNWEWSSSVSLDIESGSFEGLGQLEVLELSENNIWSLPNSNVFCPLRNLAKLNLSRNRLSDTEELSFGEMSTSGRSPNAYCALSVQNLDLSYNTLRRVGNNAFSRLRKLAELRLENNLLEELEDSAFAGIGQLRAVNLSSNRLVALPPSIFRLNPALREINLSNNSISALSPQVFAGLEALLSLDLSRNTLTSQWIKDNMFQGLRRLIILRLSLNQLSFIDGTIFKDLVSLQALYLDGNRIESTDPQAFASLSNLHVLDLSRNRLQYVDARAFQALHTLRQLYLDHNKLRSIDDSLLTNCTGLKDLGLADNLLQEVPVALTVGLSLETLDIGENRIASISNASFSRLGQLYGLRIVDNRLTHLPRGFCDPLKKLRVLNAAQNRISSVAENSFSSCPELRVLRLDSNSLEELPVSLTAQLPSLLWLNVSENRLRWADYHLLPSTIEWLDLSHNALETLGGQASTSERSQSAAKFRLRVLDASHNRLTSLDYTTVPPTLEILRVNHNRLKSVAADTFTGSSRLRRVELIGNQLESLPQSSLRFSPIGNERPLPEFYLGGNPFLCDCGMEWLTRVNQLTRQRTYPRIVDLDAIVCRPTFSRPNQVVPLVETRPKDFLCPYKSHCFALCHCCDFDACDCEMTCPGNCTCYHDVAWSANIVECSNLNYDDVPARIPMDASEIYLDGNNMSQLSSHTFIGKKNLRVLFLNDSKIELIRNKTFNGLRSLEVLRLEDNLLIQLQGFEFDDLENLRELYLQHNLLRFIAKETFVDLKFLQVLRLDGNLLIDFNVWELSGNGYLNSVMLAGNPWSCDCEFLIPFRTWVASKTAIVVDFTLANCQTVNTTHVLSSSSSDSEVEREHSLPQMDTHSFSAQVIPNPGDNSNESGSSGSRAQKFYPIQIQHPISAMCNHNSEMDFNFNPIRALESEILNNHISAMSSSGGGAAEKVAAVVPGHPADQEIQFGSVHPSAASLNTLWTLLLSLTALILLVAVIGAIFRKEIYYWVYTRVFATGGAGPTPDQELGAEESLLMSLLCCGDGRGKKSRSAADCDDSDKLFDAYFIYSQKDEDILVQKIAPELESQGPPHFRLCLHYRDLCLNPDNPWNTDMILSACDASRRVVLLLSRTLVQSELTHAHFRQAIQSAINRHQKKLILILLPPFTEQNLSTIYPELKNSSQVKSSTLQWADKNFWSKLKLILPSPSTATATNTISRRRGASLILSTSSTPLIDLQLTSGGSNSNAGGVAPPNGSYTINRLDFPYQSHHNKQSTILPYQIPLSANTLAFTPPVPKHQGQLASNTTTTLSSAFYQAQQNFYNSTRSATTNSSTPHNNNLQNFISIPGLPPNPGNRATIHPTATTLPHNNYHFNSFNLPAASAANLHQAESHPFSFNESFRRHLHHNQQHRQSPVLQFSKQSHGATGLGITAYQPLEANYSSSAISSCAEELDHVYSTLDSPTHTLSTNNPNNNASSANLLRNTSSSSNGSANDSSANRLAGFKNFRAGNNGCHNNGGNCSNDSTIGASESGIKGRGDSLLKSSPKACASGNNSTTTTSPSDCNGQPQNNGQMYFV